MADQRTPPSAPDFSRGFALVPQESTGSCPYCNGRQRIDVLTKAGRIGALVSDHLWVYDLPSDPSQHPPAPHYQVEWHAENEAGEVLPDEVTSLYLAAAQMFSQHTSAAVSG